MRCCTALLVLLVYSVSANASDPPRPLIFRDQEAPLVIEAGRFDSVRLVLPRRLLKELGGLAALDGSSTYPIRTGSLLAGISLSLFLALAGFWLMRAGRRRLAFGLTCFFLAVMGVLGTSCFHLEKKTDDARPRFGENNGTLAGQTTVELDDGDEVKVFINKDMMARFVSQASLRTDAKP